MGLVPLGKIARVLLGNRLIRELGPVTRCEVVGQRVRSPSRRLLVLAEVEPRHPQLGRRANHVRIVQETRSATASAPSSLHGARGGGSRFQNDSIGVPGPLVLIGRRTETESRLPTAGVFSNLVCVEREVVAHAEDIAPDLHRLPELHRQLVFEQPDRHSLDRDLFAVVLADPSSSSISFGIELLLGIVA